MLALNRISPKKTMHCEASRTCVPSLATNDCLLKVCILCNVANFWELHVFLRIAAIAVFVFCSQRGAKELATLEAIELWTLLLNVQALHLDLRWSVATKTKIQRKSKLIKNNNTTVMCQQKCIRKIKRLILSWPVVIQSA